MLKMFKGRSTISLTHGLLGTSWLENRMTCPLGERLLAAAIISLRKFCYMPNKKAGRKNIKRSRLFDPPNTFPHSLMR